MFLSFAQGKLSRPDNPSNVQTPSSSEIGHDSQASVKPSQFSGRVRGSNHRGGSCGKLALAGCG